MRLLSGKSMRSDRPGDFTQAAHEALADPKLQRALKNVKSGFIAKRAAAKANLPEFDALREEARVIKDHTLAHLDLYLEAYEAKVLESGGEVHYAQNAADARDIILGLCRDERARLVTKGKSMVSEEIGLNAHLERAGIEVVETDLGEHIVQIRNETPSHIIAPVIHLNRDDIAGDFVRAHPGLPAGRDLASAQAVAMPAPMPPVDPVTTAERRRPGRAELRRRGKSSVADMPSGPG